MSKKTKSETVAETKKGKHGERRIQSRELAGRVVQEKEGVGKIKRVSRSGGYPARM